MTLFYSIFSLFNKYLVLIQKKTFQVLKDGFQKYMPDFKPFLLAALENHDDAQIGIAAVGVVSDLCRAFETNISGYMDEIMERMLGILQVFEFFVEF